MNLLAYTQEIECSDLGQVFELPYCKQTKLHVLVHFSSNCKTIKIWRYHAYCQL